MVATLIISPHVSHHRKKSQLQVTLHQATFTCKKSGQITSHHKKIQKEKNNLMAKHKNNKNVSI
jgi:hypothetical protein